MMQTSFLDGPDLIAPPHNGSPTSRAAAESIAPHVSEQECRVLAFVQKHREGVTREQVSIGTGMRLQSVCGRCTALIERGLLREHGVRRGSSGRFGAVLFATKGSA